jgi:hypothetical protein
MVNTESTRVLGRILGDKSKDMNSLKYGTNVEMEHKKTYAYIRNYEEKHGKLPSDTQISRKIALNHLAERKDYYQKLKKYKL